jgi:hypothetical protein
MPVNMVKSEKRRNAAISHSFVNSEYPLRLTAIEKDALFLLLDMDYRKLLG